jgi:hypothetical protein
LTKVKESCTSNLAGYDQSNVLIQPSEELMIQKGDLIVTNQLREAGEGVKVDIL